MSSIKPESRLNTRANPRHDHDCSSCKFLGTLEEFDIYFCPRADGGSVLYRYGSARHEYGSSPLEVFNPRHFFYGTLPASGLHPNIERLVLLRELVENGLLDVAYTMKVK